MADLLFVSSSGRTIDLLIVFAAGRGRCDCLGELSLCAVVVAPDGRAKGIRDI